MRTEEDLRAALLALEREAPAAARVLPKTTIPNEQGFLPKVARHRRLAGLSAALGAAAVIGAGVAVVVALLPGARPAGHQQASHGPETLRAKLLDALSAASGEIIYERTTILSDNSAYFSPSGGAVTKSGPATGDVAESWYYPWRPKTGQLVRGRTLTLNPDGKPLQDSGVSYPEPTEAQGIAAGEYIDVDYTTHTWSEQPSASLVARSFSRSPLAIWELVHNTKWSVVGRTELDGHSAIELKFGLGSSGTLYLWVDAQTYLPLRGTFNGVAGITHSPQGTVTVRPTTRTDYQYLVPAAANLAKLTVPIPPGFRRTAQPPSTNR